MAAAAEDIGVWATHDEVTVDRKEENKEVQQRYDGPGGQMSVIAVLILVQFVNSGYTILTKVALSSGGANPLILSLFRDTMAYPILQVDLPPSSFHPGIWSY